MNWVITLFFFNPTNFIKTTDSSCINTHDLTIWNTTGQQNFRDYMNTCGSQCIGNYDCTVSCVQKIENYTTTCCDCFGNLGECTVKNCLMKCIGGDTPQCEECISSSCDGGFNQCSGLQVPKPKQS